MSESQFAAQRGKVLAGNGVHGFARLLLPEQGEYQSRIKWIENLARTSLREHTRDDLILRLLCAPEAAREVRRMVEQERICALS